MIGMEIFLHDWFLLYYQAYCISADHTKYDMIGRECMPVFMRGMGECERWALRVMMGRQEVGVQRHMAVVKKSERDGNLWKSAGGLKERSARE